MKSTSLFMGSVMPVKNAIITINCIVQTQIYLFVISLEFLPFASQFLNLSFQGRSLRLQILNNSILLSRVFQIFLAGSLVISQLLREFSLVAFHSGLLFGQLGFQSIIILRQRVYLLLQLGDVSGNFFLLRFCRLISRLVFVDLRFVNCNLVFILLLLLLFSVVSSLELVESLLGALQLFLDLCLFTLLRSVVEIE